MSNTGDNSPFWRVPDQDPDNIETRSQAFPPAQTPHPGQDQTEVLASTAPAVGPGGPVDPGGPGGPEGPARGRGKGRWIAAGAGAVALALVAGGVTFAVQMLASSGEQPEKFVPADAIALVKLDLDPSAGQKIDAIRFLRHFPELKDDVAEGGDLREAFFDAIAEGTDGLEDVDFDKEVKPWLGSRVAIAAVPPAAGSDEPDGEIVLQVSDEEKAKTGLRKLVDKAKSKGDDPGFVIRDGYAILAEDQARADRLSKAAEGAALAATPGYKTDMRGYDDGVLAAWVDVRAVAKHIPDAGAAFRSTLPKGTTGKSPVSPQELLDQFEPGSRFVSVLRFDGGNLEAKGRLTGLKRDMAAKTDVTSPIGKLPDGTVAAFGVNGLDQYVPQIWDAVSQGIEAASKADEGPSLDEFTGELADRYGIKLPDDLKTLLGRSLVVALSGDGLDRRDVKVGARVVTEPAKAQSLLGKVERFVNDIEPGAKLTLAHQATADGVVVASSREYAAELAKDGGLSRNEAFRTALPGVDKADSAIWVDVDALVAKLSKEIDDAKARENLAHVDAVGLTFGQAQKGSWEFQLKVLAK